MDTPASVALVVGGGIAYAAADVLPVQYRHLAKVGGIGVAAFGALQLARKGLGSLGLFGAEPTSTVEALVPAGPVTVGGPTAPAIQPESGAPVAGSFTIPLVGYFTAPARGGVAPRGVGSNDYDVEARIENRSDRAVADYAYLEVEEHYAVGTIERGSFRSEQRIALDPGRDALVNWNDVPLLAGFFGSAFQVPRVIARLRFAGRVLDTTDYQVGHW